jgi:hypothetical protein
MRSKVMVARVIMARGIAIRVIAIRVIATGVTMVRVIANQDTMVIDDMVVASPGRVWVAIPDIATATTVAMDLAMTSLGMGRAISDLRHLYTAMVYRLVLSTSHLLLTMKKLLLIMKQL